MPHLPPIHASLNFSATCVSRKNFCAALIALRDDKPYAACTYVAMLFSTSDVGVDATADAAAAAAAADALVQLLFAVPSAKRERADDGNSNKARVRLAGVSVARLAAGSTFGGVCGASSSIVKSITSIILGGGST
mmetsp:Transcript_944/g.2286  ORF Transcript_944/g.2286 Transcript_944/m.2286 type:complete len:135 (+) Transcript_944:16-420(+)